MAQLLEDKRHAYKAHLDDPLSTAKKDALDKRSTIQQELHQMQDTWLSNKADEIQGYEERHGELLFLAERDLLAYNIKIATHSQCRRV